ncbi:N-acetyltransferase [Sphingomonas cannabina]|uniref:GNAT family N-acetyltransferase n=1 Tax=Sphingomonas cannabina TaxID=2899123 RepID=UPI001F35A9CD|nr:GNAT family N-acetyltransferase [Sphingomonas cannabina]UIJ45601.1 N-acetyltransferase [Sphingomonas cannabina]
MSDVTDNRDANRYELVEEGHKAVAAYKLSGDMITFTHTVVPQELQGRGVASRLIKAALDDVRARGLKVVAQCPFVAAYIERHPEERDLLA